MIERLFSRFRGAPRHRPKLDDGESNQWTDPDADADDLRAALDALEESEREGFVRWQDVKRELEL